MNKTILLTNHHLKEYAGSELVTLDLALLFKSRGWSVVVATFATGRPVSDLFAAHGIPIYDVLEKPLPFRQFDLVWAHHFPVILKCLVDDGVSTRKLILSSLSPFTPIETPPLFADQADIVLANSHETFSEVKRCWKDIQPEILPNSVPMAWFNFPKRSLSISKLQRIAIISNHPPSEVSALKKHLGRQNVSTIFYGLNRKYSLLTPDVLSGCSAVVSIGRTVQHAMALGLPVYCYDHYGGPGWLTRDNYEKAERFNYSGRCTRRKSSSNEIADEIIRGFEEASANVEFFAKLAFEKYNLAKNVDSILRSLKYDDGATTDLGAFKNFSGYFLASRLNRPYVETLQALRPNQSLIELFARWHWRRERLLPQGTTRKHFFDLILNALRTLAARRL